MRISLLKPWVLLLVVAFAPCVAMAGEPQWWTQQKIDCGQPASMDYQTWQAEGSPCPGASSGGGGGGGSSNTAGGDAATMAGTMLGHAIASWIVGLFEPAPPQVNLLERQAEAFNAQGLSAFNAHNYAVAEIDFQKALELSPSDNVIAGNLKEARFRLEEPARRAAIARGFDVDAAAGFTSTTTVAGLDFVGGAASPKTTGTSLSFTGASTSQEGSLSFQDASGGAANTEALHQLRVAAGSEISAECVFEQGGSCGAEVVFIPPPGPPGATRVPPEAAKFIESIPPQIRANKAVAADVSLYERLSHVRGSVENELLQASATMKAHPDDEHAKLQTMAIYGRFDVAKSDEAVARAALQKKVQSFHVNEIPSANGTP